MYLLRAGRLTGVLLLTGQLALAQAPASVAPSLAATTYAQTVSAADLEKHLRILAADDMEGRETGTRGQKRPPITSPVSLPRWA